MSIPTPEQARQLVEHFGSQRAAAGAVGVGQSGIRYWLGGERARAYSRESGRKRRKTNPDEGREATRKWSKANPEKRRAWRRRNYHRRRNAGLCTTCGKPSPAKALCWDCSDKQADYARKRYDGLSWTERHQQQLAARRFNALSRKNDRNEGREETPERAAARARVQAKAERLLKEEIQRRQQANG